MGVIFNGKSNQRVRRGQANSHDTHGPMIGNMARIHIPRAIRRTLGGTQLEEPTLQRIESLFVDLYSAPSREVAKNLLSFLPGDWAWPWLDIWIARFSRYGRFPSSPLWFWFDSTDEGWGDRSIDDKDTKKRQEAKAKLLAVTVSQMAYQFERHRQIVNLLRDSIFEYKVNLQIDSGVPICPELEFKISRWRFDAATPECMPPFFPGNSIDVFAERLARRRD